MSRICSASDTYERIVKKTIDEFIPLKLDWEITYRCNLTCSHCYQAGILPEKELTTREIYSALDELSSLNCLYITFTGGEILLREDFFDIAGYARKREFALRLFTNGTLIDENIADKIKEIRPLSVEMSLYGMDPHIHERITGVRNSYKKTINAFRLLRERGVNTVVKCTLMKENASQFAGLKQFSDSIGSRFVFSLTVIPRINGGEEPLKARLNEDELKGIFRSESRMMEGVTKGGVHSYNPLCSAGINSLYISPYGDVFPCVALRKRCGNIREESLEKIWQSGFFQKIRDITFDDLTICKSCGLAHYCDRCAGLALMETGDLFGPSPNECVLAGVRKWAMERKV